MPEKDERIDKVVDVLYDNLHLEVPLTKEYLREVINTAITFDTKQRDYSTQNIAEFSALGVLIRMSDKFSRLKNLLLHNKKPQHETIEDTWLDISIYGIIGLLCHKGKWPGQREFKIITDKKESSS